MDKYEKEIEELEEELEKRKRSRGRPVGSKGRTLKEKIRDVQIHERLKQLRKESKKYKKRNNENYKKYAKKNTVAECNSAKNLAKIYERMDETMELLIEQKKITNEEIIKTLEKTNGNIAKTARLLNLSETTLFRKKKKDPEIIEFFEILDQRLIDKARGVLNNKLDDEDVKAAIFVLETKGKEEGYHKKIVKEVSGKDGKPIEIENKTKDTLKNADKAINKALGVI